MKKCGKDHNWQIVKYNADITLINIRGINDE